MNYLCGVNIILCANHSKYKAVFFVQANFLMLAHYVLTLFRTYRFSFVSCLTSLRTACMDTLTISCKRRYLTHHFFPAIVRSEKHNRTETNTRMFLNTQQSFKCIAWMWTLSRYSRSRCENSSYAETNGKINKLFTHGGKGDIYLTTPPLESKPSSSQKRASINQY